MALNAVGIPTNQEEFEVGLSKLGYKRFVENLPDKRIISAGKSNYEIGRLKNK